MMKFNAYLLMVNIFTINPIYSADQMGVPDVVWDLWIKEKLLLRCLEGIEAWHLLQVDKKWSEAICTNRNTVVENFNKEYGTQKFNIMKAGLFVNDSAMADVDSDKEDLNVESDSDSSDAENEAILKKERTPKKSKYKILTVTSDDPFAPEIKINPATVLFDFSGNYAAGYATELGIDPATRYIFTYPESVLVKKEVVDISRTGCTVERAIRFAVTDIKRTLSFMATMQYGGSCQAKAGYMKRSDVNSGDLVITIGSWKSTAHKYLINYPLKIRATDSSVSFEPKSQHGSGVDWGQRNCDYVIYNTGNFVLNVYYDNKKTVYQSTWRGSDCFSSQKEKSWHDQKDQCIIS